MMKDKEHVSAVDVIKAEIAFQFVGEGKLGGVVNLRRSMKVELVTDDVLLLVEVAWGVGPVARMAAADVYPLGEGEVVAVGAGDLDGGRVVSIVDDDVASAFGQDVGGGEGTCGVATRKSVLPSSTDAEVHVAIGLHLWLVITTDEHQEHRQGV